MILVTSKLPTTISFQLVSEFAEISGCCWTINSSDSWDWLCNAASKHFNRALLAITLAPLEPKRRRSAQMAFKPTSSVAFVEPREIAAGEKCNEQKKTCFHQIKRDVFSPIQWNFGIFCLFFLAKKSGVAPFTITTSHWGTAPNQLGAHSPDATINW